MLGTLGNHRMGVSMRTRNWARGWKIGRQGLASYGWGKNSIVDEGRQKIKGEGRVKNL